MKNSNKNLIISGFQAYFECKKTFDLLNENL